MPHHSLKAIAALLVATCPWTVQSAGFGIDATRLIYPQSANSISVNLRNTRESGTYLVQVSIGLTPDSKETAPFVVTPPIFRLEPSSKNQVRISAIRRESLPTDRESVFYLKANAIPAGTTPDQAGRGNTVEGSVQLGIGNTIKLFYRPAGLKTTSLEAQKNLILERTSTGIRLENPSPYHINLASLKINNQQIPMKTMGTRMITPYGSQDYQIPMTKAVEVKWATIGDEGGVNAFSKNLP